MSDNPTPSLSLDEKRQILTRFSKAIKREAHNLQHWPDLLWPQLYNRLQWDEEPVPQALKPEYERRTAPGAALWMRTRTPYRESEAIVRTLSGHTGILTTCCMSSDGRWVVSGSKGNYPVHGTLKVWDVETGQEEKTLSGHASTCCMSPDGRWIVSGSDDHTLKVWDMETGKKEMTLSGHTGPIRACCMSPDGRWIVSGSDDHTIKVWDVKTGYVQTEFILLGSIQSLSFHPWKPVLACRDVGGSVYIVELMGTAYGPIIVTAVELGKGAVMRCPACLQRLPLKKAWLGQVISCPKPGCEGHMKVNLFIAGQPRRP